MSCIFNAFFIFYNRSDGKNDNNKYNNNTNNNRNNNDNNNDNNNNCGNNSNIYNNNRRAPCKNSTNTLCAVLLTLHS